MTKLATKGIEKVAKPTRRIDSAINEQKVISYIIGFLEEKGRIPKLKEIMKATGLSQKTCVEYRKKVDITQVIDGFKQFTPEVIWNIKENTKQNSGSQRLWAEWVEGFNPKIQAELDVKVTSVNYTTNMLGSDIIDTKIIEDENN